jgi:hypothetical protein
MRHHLIILLRRPIALLSRLVTCRPAASPNHTSAVSCHFIALSRILTVILHHPVAWSRHFAVSFRHLAIAPVSHLVKNIHLQMKP